MPCKGVELGDIGPKFGYKSKCNGWASFNQVRIPRSQLLAKYTKIDREGNFSIEGDVRILYSVMMDIRTQLGLWSSVILFKALMIGGRYSCVRRQFRYYAGSKEQETKLIDFQTQQLKLFPLLSAAYTFVMTHKTVYDLYVKMQEEIKEGNFDNLEL